MGFSRQEYWSGVPSSSPWAPLAVTLLSTKGFPGGSEVKAAASNVGDPDLIPGSGRFPGEGNSNSFQYSCLENPMDGGAWKAAVHGVAEDWAQLSNFTFTFHFHALEDMAPHSSTLAWKTPWTEEPGRLQSKGWLGVRQD